MVSPPFDFFDFGLPADDHTPTSRLQVLRGHQIAVPQFLISLRARVYGEGTVSISTLPLITFADLERSATSCAIISRFSLDLLACGCGACGGNATRGGLLTASERGRLVCFPVPKPDGQRHYMSYEELSASLDTAANTSSPDEHNPIIILKSFVETKSSIPSNVPLLSRCAEGELQKLADRCCIDEATLRRELRHIEIVQVNRLAAKEIKKSCSSASLRSFLISVKVRGATTQLRKAQLIEMVVSYFLNIRYGAE